MNGKLHFWMADIRARRTLHRLRRIRLEEARLRQRGYLRARA